MKPIFRKVTDFFCLVLILLVMGFLFTKLVVSIHFSDEVDKPEPVGTKDNPIYFREVDK